MSQTDELLLNLVNGTFTVWCNRASMWNGSCPCCVENDVEDPKMKIQIEDLPHEKECPWKVAYDFIQERK